MTRPIYEPSLQRTDARMGYTNAQLLRRPPPPSAAGQYPITFRAAIGCIPDAETNRKHYPSANGADDVWWDTWDTSYDTSVFDTGPFEFTDPFTGRPSIDGVQLLVPGLYSIYWILDIGQYLNGITQTNSGFDADGQAVYLEHNMDPDDNEQFLDDSMGIRGDQWRQVNWTPDDDGYWGGDQNNVFITLAQNNDATINYYGDSPGTVPLISPSDPPTPDSDVWIPGGQQGAWGIVPRMIVMYWGVPSSGWDPEWPNDAIFTCDS